MRVLVPFGRGNRSCEGIVLQVEDAPAGKLKAVLRALDEKPVLWSGSFGWPRSSGSGISAPTDEAARAILPVGLWFKATETYSICRERGDWRSATAHNVQADRVMQILEDYGGCAAYPAIREQFPDDQTAQTAIRFLLGKKAYHVRYGHGPAHGKQNGEDRVAGCSCGGGRRLCAEKNSAARRCKRRFWSFSARSEARPAARYAI